MDPGMSNESIAPKSNAFIDFLFLRRMLFILSKINVSICRLGKIIKKTYYFPSAEPTMMLL